MPRAFLLALLLGGCFFEPTRPGGDTSGTKIVKMAVGARHVCVLDASGRVQCWGRNTSGEIDTSMNAYPSPNVVSDAGWTDIAAGATHTCGIRDGGVYCWGDGRPTVPIDLPAGFMPAHVFAGANASCTTDVAGTIYCWGRIDSTQPAFADPQQVVPAGVSAQYELIAIAGDHACAHTSTNDVYCWGTGDDHQITGSTSKSINSALMFPMKLDTVSVATGASCGVASDTKAVVCWGRDIAGQLGDQTAPSDAVVVDAMHSWTSVAVGPDHVCALRGDATVSCWGDNERGALGDGFTRHRAVHSVPMLSSVLGLGVGDDHSCALDDKGAVYCWGSNAYGELGNGEIATSIAAVDVALPAGPITSLATGDGHSCAVVQNTVYCWGDNRVGQASTVDTSPFLVAPKSATTLALGVVSAGAQHTCGISVTDSSQLHCWGANESGELGPSAALPISTVHTTDVEQTGPWAEVSAGTGTTCARTVGTNLVCWGALSAGDTGPYVTVDAGTPKYTGPLATGNAFSLVMTSNSVIESFGDGADAGEMPACEQHFGGSENAPNTMLGGTTNDIEWSFAVANGGGAHACMRHETSGQVVIECIGRNDNGQAGPLVAVCQRNTVVPPVAGWAGSRQSGTIIAVSGDHSCALDNAGHIDCWGANTRGELGPLAGGSSTPQQAADGMYGSIATGAHHTCAITSDSTKVQCWGENRFGELGNGKRFHDTPTAVQF